MVGVNLDPLLRYDADEFVLHIHMHMHMHVLLINVTIINQLLTINIRLQKHKCITQFLLR